MNLQPVTPAMYTAAERLHNCQACTLAVAMKACKACMFYTPGIRNPINSYDK